LVDGPSTTFTVSVEGIAETEAASPQILHDHRYRAQAPSESQFATMRLYCTSSANNPLKKPMILTALSYLASFCESATADKVMRCYGASGEGVASFGR
jgi:hypothetical protein